jgi:hypothetical protein
MAAQSVEVESLLALARRNKNRGYHDAARNAMRQAQSKWSPELNVERPDFSPREWRELNLDQVKKLEDLARKNKNGGYHDAARNAMRQAQSKWSSELNVERPDFSPREWQELDFEQYRSFMSLMQQNAQMGWTAGAIAAREEALQVWERLPTPRPSRPAPVVDNRRIHSTPLVLQSSGATFDCPVCLEPVEGCQPRFEHDCRKQFCEACISRWATFSSTCPMCRQDL